MNDNSAIILHVGNGGKQKHTVLCKRNANEMPKSAKLHEFLLSNFELSFQTKMRRNFGASIVLMSAKFRKQCDESASAGKS